MFPNGSEDDWDRRQLLLPLEAHPLHKLLIESNLKRDLPIPLHGGVEDPRPEHDTFGRGIAGGQ